MLATVENRLRRQQANFPPIARDKLDALQVNLGYRCNQACAHCHVDAGPNRTEEMSAETIEVVLDFLARRKLKTLDLTGGAPELNPHFRTLVTRARQLGVKVIDRCNLTILEEPGQHDLADFLAANGVAVTASLPCYSEENVDLQRGRGIYEKSIRGLKALNALGYGSADSDLTLNLVYNPTGAFLPPNQLTLEQTYREALFTAHGIEFTELLTLANMPIARFRHALARDGELDDYLSLLVGAHRSENLSEVMCRRLISVDWRGYVYDCDFNQMLALPLSGSVSAVHISELIDWDENGEAIATADHCFACTAGQGSSCAGALKSGA